MQIVIVIICLSLSLAYVVWRLRKAFSSSQGDSCSCCTGGAGCPHCSYFPLQDKKNKKKFGRTRKNS